MSELNAILEALIHARHFEDAVEIVLRASLRRVEHELLASKFAKRARLLRGTVHVRPADGYKRLLSLEHGADPRSAVDAFLPSASAWRWVEKHKRPVAMDVNVGTIDVIGHGAVVIHDQPPQGSLTQESQQRLLVREATHVLAIPLRSSGGEVDGMIAFEVDCRSAMGQPFVFEACCNELQLYADMGAAYLRSLPTRPSTTTKTDKFLPVIGATMSSIVSMLRVFAEQDETILIGGPTGSGKSRLARWCHAQSPRRDRPFESINLMTVPEELQMAEIFGWKKGAFTGAVKDNPGHLARAEGGTLFIDEIDKLSLKAQAGLLQMLEERKYRPLGEGSAGRHADVRFIIGSNVSLQSAVRAGSFREDLYYRINVLPVKLPPLDDRLDEIVPWARHMASRRHAETSASGFAEIAPEAEIILTSQPWPGNLRQLDNIVRRAYALALKDQGPGGPQLRVQAEHVRRALAYEGGGPPSLAVEALLRAATMFVEEAARRSENGGSLDLELANGFRGFVMGLAIRKAGPRRALRMLGRDSDVDNRNSWKIIQREIERADALADAFSCEKLFGDLDSKPREDPK